MWLLNIVLFTVCHLLVTNYASAVTLYSEAANQVVYVDQTFVIDWYLDTQGKEINTVFMKLNFSKDVLEVVEAKSGGSNLNLWIKPPEYNNQFGTIELTGGISGGVSDSRIRLFSATFKPTQTGNARIIMDENSTVLLSDGSGTPTELTFKQLDFAVLPSDALPYKLSSPTHPVPTNWYKNKTVEINFEAKEEDEYSYSFSSNVDLIPDDLADDVKSGKLKFSDLPDGVYYFKLNYKTKNIPTNWIEAGVFRVQVDSTPPQGFEPTVGSDPSLFNGKAFISFGATDQTSGVAKYEVKFGALSSWREVESTVIEVPGLVLGDSIQIRVVDGAGNVDVKSIGMDSIPKKSLFQRWFIWIIIIVGLLLAILAYGLSRFLRKKYTI